MRFTLLVFLASLLGACATSDSPPSAETACVSGDRFDCVCSDGTTGWQECVNGNSLSECACGTAAADAGNASDTSVRTDSSDDVLAESDAERDATVDTGDPEDASEDARDAEPPEDTGRDADDPDGDERDTSAPDAVTDAEGCPESPCEAVGTRCEGTVLIDCYVDADLCLVANQTDCSATNRLCDEAAEAARACVTAIDPCEGVRDCETAGSECDGNTLVRCAADADGCLVTTRFECLETESCVESAMDAMCVTDDPCAAISPCTPGARCEGGAYFVCEEDEDGCLVESSTPCTEAETCDPGAGCVAPPYRHTIVMDGVNDFTADETFPTSSEGYTTYIAWDETYLYLGMQGPDIRFGNPTTWILLYVGGAPGTNEGVVYETQQPTLRFDAHVHFRVKTDRSYMSFMEFDGVDWVEGDLFPLWLDDVGYSGDFVEARIELSDLGVTDRLELHISMLNEAFGGEWSWAATPATSFVDGVDPDYSAYFDFDLLGTTPPASHAVLP